jgi:hypothetical protein
MPEQGKQFLLLAARRKYAEDTMEAINLIKHMAVRPVGDRIYKEYARNSGFCPFKLIGKHYSQVFHQPNPLLLKDYVQRTVHAAQDLTIMDGLIKGALDIITRLMVVTGGTTPQSGTLLGLTIYT